MILKLLLSFVLMGFSKSPGDTHTIQKKETLSCMAETFIGRPVYGASGSLGLIKEANPQLKDQDYIYAGDTIRIPEKDLKAQFQPSDIKLASKKCLETPLKDYYLSRENMVTQIEPNSTKKSDHTHKLKTCECEHNKEKTASDPLVSERFSKGLGLYQNTLTYEEPGTGARAEFTSRENIFFHAGYQIKRNAIWWGVRGEYHIQAYENQINPIYDWDEDVPHLIKLSFTSDYEENFFNLGLDLDYNQELFFQEDNFDVSLKEVFMLGASVRGSIYMVKTKPFSSSFGFKVSYPYKGSDELNPEGDLSGEVFLRLNKNNFLTKYQLNAEVFYSQKSFTTDTYTLEENAVGLRLSLRNEILKDRGVE